MTPVTPEGLTRFWGRGLLWCRLSACVSSLKACTTTRVPQSVGRPTPEDDWDFDCQQTRDV